MTLESILESIFKFLCDWRIYHIYLTNEKKEDRCVYCNREVKYDEPWGFFL